MILVDFSSIMHRFIHTSISHTNPRLQNNLYITSDYSKLLISMILEELINLKFTYKNYGEIVIAFDNYTEKNWRKDLFKDYKASRSKDRSTSKVNFSEVFEIVNELIENIKAYLPWKTLDVPKAEADDIILILAEHYTNEKILIYSPDKDFIQAQKNSNVDQYSPLTRKWIKPENKNLNMKEWLQEHVILGDEGDGVPKILECTEFSDSFIKHLSEFSEIIETENIKDVLEFRKLNKEVKLKIINSFKIYKTNRKGENTILDIYKTPRFGLSNIKNIKSGNYKKKLIQEEYNTKIKALRKLKKEVDKLQKPKINSKILELIKLRDSVVVNESSTDLLDEFINSNELYKEHYERNKKLVLTEGIPKDIKAKILEQFLIKHEYNKEKFDEYLMKNSLTNIMMELPKVFSSEELSIDNCGW